MLVDGLVVEKADLKVEMWVVALVALKVVMLAVL